MVNPQEGQSFTINEDGSITRSNSGGGSNHNDSSNGCIWFVILAVIVIIIIVIISNNNASHDSTDHSTFEDSDTIELVDDPAIISVAEEANENNYLTASYLNVSDNDIYMNAAGGEVEISVSTDGEWSITTDTESWGHTSSYRETITLRLDKNTSSATRTDYFVVSADSYTKRINITQYGNTEPSAEIESVWADHNINNNGYTGMKIHVKFNVNNMNGKTVYLYAYFYYGDNATPLHDSYGNNLKFYGYGTPSYDNATFSDFTIFVPYQGLNMGLDSGSVDLSFDISITDGSGNQLARHNNTSFIFSRG